MEEKQKNMIPNDKIKSNKNPNVPNLRFPYFTSLWQKNKFGDLLILLKNSTLSRSELNYNNGKIKNIHYGDILIKFNDYILSDSKIIPYVNNGSIPNNYSKLLLKNGDIIIADTAEDNTVGKATEIIFNDKSLIISGLHTITCRPMKNTFASKYLGYYLNSPSFHNQLLPLIQGIKVSSISKSQIVDTQIAYPNIKEQQKIAEILSLIDQRIETQSKIIEKIKLFKNIISDHLLYSNQLSEFINLSYYATLKNGYTFKSSEYDSNGIYNVITIANVTGERYIDIVGCNKINAIPQDIQEHQQLKNNNILISLTGNVGRVSLCNKNNCLLNQRVGVLEIKNDNYNEFIFQCLSNKHFEKTMILKGQGVAQLNISKKDVENFKIPKISLDKLNQICNILNFLDKKIAIEKEIYNDYHQMKKYLLLNMFI